MKKGVIWFLIVVMALTFASLLTLQYSYIHTLTNTRSEQFDEAVSRSLFQVVRNLELDESARFLEEGIEEKEKSTQIPQLSDNIILKRKTSRLLSIGGVSTFSSVWEYEENTTLTQSSPKVFISMRDQNNSLSKTTQKMQETLRERYLTQKKFLDDVILRILYEANDLPVEQRVDFSKLEHYLTVELSNNGLGNMPFHFMVTDKNNNEVYRSKDMIGKLKGGYKQALFPNDPGVRTGTLYLYFPTRKDYIYDTLKIFVPSILFSIVLLLVFASTIFVIFRQKKLSDMKNDFVNNMTHELKTPISTISLAAQMLKDADVGKTPAMLKHISGVIVDESKRLGFQVEKVLQVSLFERDNSTLTFKEVDVNEMLDSVVATFKLKVESFDGNIQTDLKAPEAEITADEMHLTNVFFNLMDNAVKYRSSDRDLKLDVSTWNEKGRLMISIKDNGIGIKKEHLKKVFDRFYRVPTGNVHNVKGFGLGLAYVKKIVENHNGTIRAESEQNSGTEFIISLPLIKNEL
jgi:two-component system, OmpR family, phosphate regulon sensor histidine kinase PhoR